MRRLGLGTLAEDSSPCSSGPPPLPCHPLSQPNRPAVGERRDFTQDSGTPGTPRLRTAGCGFIQTVCRITKSRVFPTQTDNCPSVQPPVQHEGAFLVSAGGARLHYSAKPAAPSPEPSLQPQTAHMHTSSGLFFYTEVSGTSSISSNALRVVLLLFLEESWILLKSA